MVLLLGASDSHKVSGGRALGTQCSCIHEVFLGCLAPALGLDSLSCKFHFLIAPWQLGLLTSGFSLGESQGICKSGMMAPIWNSSIQGVEAGDLQVQGYPVLRSEVVSTDQRLGYSSVGEQLPCKGKTLEFKPNIAKINKNKGIYTFETSQEMPWSPSSHLPNQLCFPWGNQRRIQGQWEACPGPQITWFIRPYGWV